MHTVKFRRQAGSRTELKHTPFYTNSPSALLCLISDSVLLTHSLLSKSSPFFSQKTCREERRRRKEETRRRRQEREEAEKVGRGARGREERREVRGRPDGRKEGKDLSAGSSARLKDSA